MEEDKNIKVEFTIPAKEYYQVMVALNNLLGTANIATALFSAASMILLLYKYQNQGWEIAVTKGRTVLPFKLPTLR